MPGYTPNIFLEKRYSISTSNKKTFLTFLTKISEEKIYGNGQFSRTNEENRRFAKTFDENL